jgi:hypothetical protein
MTLLELQIDTYPSVRRSHNHRGDSEAVLL